MFDAIAVPFGMLMMWLYEFCNNYGLAVILFAVIVNVILLPFQMKAKRGTMRQTRLQPKIKELEKKHGANQQKYRQEVMNLYKEEGVNSMSGCLWSFLPLPIMFALYKAITAPITIMMGIPSSYIEEGGAIARKLAELGFDAAGGGYQQIAQTRFISDHFSEFDGISESLKNIDYRFLGIDLGATPRWKLWEFDWSAPEKWLPMVLLFLVPVVTAGITVAQTLITQKISPPPAADGQGASSMNMKSMMLMMPAMMLFFGFAAPAALGIYWSAGSALNILRDIWLTKRYNRLMDIEDEQRLSARAKKEAELELKRRETERLKAENKTALNPSTSKKKRELAEKKEREIKAADWEKKHSGAEEAPEEPSREGTRRYARGRAYDPRRYEGALGAGEEPPGEDAEDQEEE
ncbi:MAG: membrane protein insertase YidC [Oscillospiraceae bacterium]|jgi:YidC/Oxa1 family membrane protein insertase|nr:membrane protein insertase YidC [Oscillospiraceae bacterium]